MAQLVEAGVYDGKAEAPEGRFGRLVVVGYAGYYQYAGGRRHAWRCRCDCGVTKVVQRGSLRDGATQSCGCLHRERAKDANTHHGRRYSAAWRTWSQLVQRCTNPKHISYRNYGGRGVTFDPKWAAFAGFYEDMGDPPFPGLTIDRIDNDGPYCKANCRWATRAVQNDNKRRSVRVTWNGKTQTIRQWSNELGIGYKTLRNRLFVYGWGVESAMTIPPGATGRRKPTCGV